MTDTNSLNPTVHAVRHVVTMADRAEYVAVIQYPGEPARGVAFIGSSTPGHPGPVMMLSRSEGGLWRAPIHVASPVRFGDTFNAEWVRRFFTGSPADSDRYAAR